MGGEPLLLRLLIISTWYSLLATVPCVRRASVDRRGDGSDSLLRWVGKCFDKYYGASSTWNQREMREVADGLRWRALPPVRSGRTCAGGIDLYAANSAQ